MSTDGRPKVTLPIDLYAVATIPVDGPLAFPGADVATVYLVSDDGNKVITLRVPQDEHGPLDVMVSLR